MIHVCFKQGPIQSCLETIVNPRLAPRLSRAIAAISSNIYAHSYSVSLNMFRFVPIKVYVMHIHRQKNGGVKAQRRLSATLSSLGSRTHQLAVCPHTQQRESRENRAEQQRCRKMEVRPPMEHNRTQEHSQHGAYNQYFSLWASRDRNINHGRRNLLSSCQPMLLCSCSLTLFSRHCTSCRQESTISA